MIFRITCWRSIRVGNFDLTHTNLLLVFINVQFLRLWLINKTYKTFRCRSVADHLLYTIVESRWNKTTSIVLQVHEFNFKALECLKYLMYISFILITNGYLNIVSWKWQIFFQYNIWSLFIFKVKYRVPHPNPDSHSTTRVRIWVRYPVGETLLLMIGHRPNINLRYRPKGKNRNRD